MLLRPHLRNLLPYEPGKPIEEVQRELGLKKVAKLASNENPLGPSKLVFQAIKKSLTKINLYPDGSGYYLKKTLSKKIKLKEENLILGNGSDEIVNLIVLSFLNAGEEVISADGAFIRYQMAVQLIPGRNVLVPMKNYTHNLNVMADRIISRTKIIFIANPNNPTGTMVTKSEVDEFLKRVPENIIIVFDEAYYEFVTRKDYPQTINYIKDGRNVIVLRTFSKMYGLAGLRIGYGIGREDLIRDMNRVRCPFNTNTLAQAAALAVLKDKNNLQKIRKNNIEGKKYLYNEFKKMGLFFVPSEANFVLVKVNPALPAMKSCHGVRKGGVNQSGREMYHKLLKEGVIVRPMDGYKMPDFIRVTIGRPSENRKFIASLKKIMI